MAWPPASNIANGLGYEGIAPVLLAWGTDGLYSGVIVKSMRSSQMSEEIKIENGTGLTAKEVLLVDGDEMEVTVVDDRNVTFPSVGGIAAIINPRAAGASLSSVTNFMVVNNNYNAARKTDGERTLLVKRYTLFAPTAM